jgi:hypothetical protein
VEVGGVDGVVFMAQEVESHPTLANTFFSIDNIPQNQEQFAIIWEGWQWTFTVLSQCYLHCPTFCHGMMVADLGK